MPELPTLKLTSNKIEDIILERIPAVAKGKLSPKAMLSLSVPSFKVDSPYVVPEEPIKRKVLFGSNKVYLEDAEKLLEKIKSVSGGILPDSRIAELVGEFGRDKKGIFNLVNLENAIVLYVSENIREGKELFADPVFITLVRLYFSEYIGELAVVEQLLATLGERGFATGYHISRLQDEYEDMVEWEKFARIYKNITGRKIEVEAGVKKLREAIEARFKETQKNVAGTKGSAQKLLAFLERAAAAAFSYVEMTRKKQQILDAAGTYGHVWVEEGKGVIDVVTKYLSKKGNPDVLENKDFIELSSMLGIENTFNLVGIQSALMQIIAQAVEDDKDIDDLILESPLFTTLLRLYFAALIMKLGITELIMTVFGEAKVMTRLRGGRLSDDFDDLVKVDFYKELIEGAKKAKSQ